MPTYTYIGLSDAGERVNGVVEAYDEIEAMEQARDLCRIVQSVKEVRDGKNILAMDITKPKAKPKTWPSCARSSPPSCNRACPSRAP